MTLRGYKHLSYTDRLKIESGLKMNMPIKQIAVELGVHISTVYREVKRATYMMKTTYYDQYTREKEYRYKEVYNPDEAERRYRENMAAKGATLKIGNDYQFAEYIEHKIIDEGYSPDAVLGEIKRKRIEFKTSICTTTLYSYIEKGVFGRLSLEHLTDKSKKKRTKREVVIKRPPRGTSIEKRSTEILKRDEFGHWEMDCVCGPTKNVFLVLTERKTRREIIMGMMNQQANSVIHCLNVLERKYGKLFRKVFKTITVDNGSEFSAFSDMEKSIYGRGKAKRTQVFYCHPYFAAERGSNERMNREIRRKAPKGSDLSKFSAAEIEQIEHWLNHYPRRILAYATAQELFDEELAKLTS
jgi:IS30 family transposase